jgi:hypothetical protein
VVFLDQVLLRPEAPRHDHFAVLLQRLADRAERLLYRGVDEAAGVDDDKIRVLVARRGGIAFGAQLRKDALRIDQRLRTA